jgi:hypothetical protein
VGVLVDEVAWINDNPEEAKTLFAEFTKNPQVMLLDKPNDYPDALRLDVPGLQHDIDLAVKFGYARTRFNAPELVDHNLIDEYLRGGR